MFARTPEGNVSVTNATSGMPRTTESRPTAVIVSGKLVQPVQEDREVVRAEIPDDAHITLVQPEVHPAGGDEVDLAELVLLDQPPRRANRRAVQEGLSAHEHAGVRVRQVDQALRFLAGAGERLLDEGVLACLQALQREPVVRVDRGGEDDGIELRILQKIVEARGCVDAGMPAGEVIQPLLVEVADAAQVDALHVDQDA